MHSAEIVAVNLLCEIDIDYVWLGDTREAA